MRVDLHMHTGYSADADYPQTIDDKIAACEQAGLDIIGLTDHLDFYRRIQENVAAVEKFFEFFPTAAQRAAWKGSFPCNLRDFRYNHIMIISRLCHLLSL